MRMQHEAILYSLDHEITRRQLEAGEEILYDTEKYERIKEWTEIEHIQAIFAAEHHKLAVIKPQPYILYYLGDISLLNKKILGIVGPRKMSAYGKNVIETLFASVPEYDIVTISGMAEGVDQLCHTLSIKNNIPTIAVLGWGLWRYANKPERTIIQQIVAAGGLVISEFRLLEQPTHYTFPQRNRIIAGLSDLLFLPEAGKKSGSLITVDFALAMKTPVYATPSSIFSSTSEGILQLMESWHVKPVVDLKRFLHQHFPFRETSFRAHSSIELTDQEQQLLDELSYRQGCSLQSLLHATGTDIDNLIQLMTILEIKWLVYQDTPGNYCLTTTTK